MKISHELKHNVSGFPIAFNNKKMHKMPVEF